MNSWNVGLVVLACLVWPQSEGRQFCGSDLANVMQLVCSGRGYNAAFRSEHTGERRYKRGIVDECCRRGCTWSTLETYCSPSPSNVNIRKRSDYTSRWLPDSSETKSKIEKFKYDISDSSQEDFSKRKLKISFDEEKSFSQRLNSIRDDTNRSGVAGERSQGGKVKRNDISDQFPNHNSKLASISFGINWQSGKMERRSGGETVGNSPGPRIPIRHRHRKADTFRKTVKESSNGQVGTIPPYFLGRTLVLSSTSRKI